MEAISTVLSEYPQFGLEHFFKLSYREGGLTRGQLKVLFSEYERKENEKRKFEILLHGGKIDDDETTTVQANNLKNKSFVFGAPEDYAHMTKEEKEELTRKMMKAHKSALAESKTSLA